MCVGGVGALFATWLIQSWLFEVARSDPTTFATVALGLILVSLVASYVPARRAMSVDPMIALRAD